MARDGHKHAVNMFQEFEGVQPSNWRVDHQTGWDFTDKKKWGFLTIKRWDLTYLGRMV